MSFQRRACCLQLAPLSSFTPNTADRIPLLMSLGIWKFLVGYWVFNSLARVALASSIRVSPQALPLTPGE